MDSLGKRLDEQKNEITRVSSSAFQQKKQLSELTDDMKPLTDYEHNFLKELCKSKWDSLLKRVEKISTEVFEQVLEAEMELTKIEAETI